ncbi:TPA: SGNH/GDSL hydrolase family protein [Klebsiella pneumoniae subsp. pneumoniae]|uniref:SGNH/GDSL hydrolase family protein n=1 Tax=Klebsiella pneumoniae TaxID=573 RepID=UPI000E2A703B|nr:SGNH/GDSL hydrolase family protein [Klebsiella pneumoniae]HDU4554267.1 SGNH/GDSL hydrolase family protein [Klebsiella pneumoniae subsp. pneumoniae]ELA2161970.1 SGNH/GDSL hydrolase family protein [Klebsiella pneumoniae]MDU1895788.1 SGNH/GDSL hydrolase family protein [Klebsiella pneumoniae]MEC6327630.1 SGNH/GDSL hydrolase family protein [Klebsiella pneumoniae]SVW98366.1 flagellar biosynthesis, cell-distal portion of basal-body rod [Klebsiella pneumoniae]
MAEVPLPTPTDNPAPSTDIRDAVYAGAMLDKVVTSTDLTYTDRLGGEHYTVDGMKAEGDKVVEETRQNLIPLSKQYVDLASAQADIANIPVNSFTYVRDQSGDALALEYQNVEGTLTATGRKMPSQQSVDDVYAFIADNDILSPGRNIYNYRTALDGKYLNEAGIVTDNPDYILSDYMPVAANSNYATNYNLRFVHCFDANKNLLSYQEFQTAITTPTNCAYIRISMAIASKQLLQIEAGTLKTPFKDYRENIVTSLDDGTPVSARNVMGVTPGKNLFNKATATQGYAINENGELIVASTYFVSDYIKVASGTTLRPSQPGRYINFYDANKTWLSSLQNQNGAFAVPSSAAYLRISVLLARIDYFQLEIGSNMTAYEPYSLTAATSLNGDGLKYPVNEPDIYSIGLFNAGKNIYNPYTLTAGYIDENGFVVPGGTTYKFSDYLPVKASTGYVGNKSMRFINIYDADKAFISTLTSTNTFTTPSNAAYVRVTLALANITGFQLEEGSSVSSYEAFSYTMKSTLPHGEPVNIDTSVDVATPDYFGLERLRETHQRLNKLRFGVTGLSARLTIASGIDSYSRDTSIYLLRSARQLWSIYQSGAANVSSGPIGWGYLSFGGADTSLKNGSIINPNAVTASGFLGTYYGGDSPDISVMESSTVGATLSWAEDFRLARSHTLFAEGGSGVISYFASGMSAPTQIDLSLLPAGIQFVPLNDIPTTSNGTFTITVVSGNVKLYGMNIIDPVSSGIVWHKLGASGSSTANWIARDATRWKQSFAALGADLFTIMTGTNDQGAAMSMATFRTNLLQLIDRARSARPTIDILLICPAENQRTTNVYPMKEYARIMYEIARDDRDVAFLNLQESFGVMPADYAAGSLRPWMNIDGIHPDADSGGYAIVAALMRAMGLPAV